MRPRSAELICAAVWLLCAALLVDAVVRAGLPGLRVVPVLALAAAGAWALLWAPRVVLHPAEVEVRNILRTVHLPFPAIRRVRLGAMLRFDALDPDGHVRTVTAWNAPGVGRDRPGRHGERVRVGQRRPRHVGPAERLARDQEASPSAIIRERWEQWSDQHEAGAGATASTAGAGDRIRTALNPVPIVVLATAVLAVLLRYAI